MTIEIGYNLKDLGERPPCPCCKTPNPQSRGSEWQCRSCYHKFVKRHRPLRKIDYGVSCPECASREISSWGIQWACRSCGRKFAKNRRTPDFVLAEDASIIRG